MNTTTAKLSHVETIVEPASEWGPESIVVTPFWTGVDRPRSSSVSFTNNANGRKMAAKMAAAMECGDWIVSADVKTDVNGATYVAAEYVTIGKYAKAKLAELGY